MPTELSENSDTPIDKKLGTISHLEYNAAPFLVLLPSLFQGNLCFWMLVTLAISLSTEKNHLSAHHEKFSV